MDRDGDKTMSINLLALGGGVDSTALALIDAHRIEACRWLDIAPASLDAAFPPCDAWVFSDPGAEFPATYRNLERLQLLADAGAHRFVTVQKEGETIVEYLLRLGTVPLMPGGPHTCSLKFKGEVLQKWAKAEFEGQSVTWAIGIEANEGARSKRFKAAKDAMQIFRYPLRELGLTRTDCLDWLRHIGWGEVAKSSCTFCPFMQEEEIVDLFRNQPDAAELARRIEARFEETSAVKHAAWNEAGQPLNSAGHAPRGMWRRDSWRAGARLWAKEIGGRRLRVAEWEIYAQGGMKALNESRGQLCFPIEQIK